MFSLSHCNITVGIIVFFFNFHAGREYVICPKYNILNIIFRKKKIQSCAFQSLNIVIKIYIVSLYAVS